MACTGDAVIISDSAENVTHLNGPAELLTGWSQAEALGHSVSDILGDGARSHWAIPSHPKVMNSVASENSTCTATGTLLRRDGSELNITNCSAHIHDRDGNVTGTVTVLHDLGTVHEKTLELSHAAQHDFLTDLPNRSLVNDRINQAISFAARYNKHLAVMFVDLDLFKRINDSLGHAVGDKLLQQVATRIVACLRRSDTVRRIGGDEFVILLSQVGHPEDAIFIARKTLSSLAAPYLIVQKQLQINASIGVSTYPDVFQLQLSAKISIGCFESRPQLYKRHFFQPSECHHLERPHRHRKEPEAPRGRRRRGDRGTIALSPKRRLQRGPGFFLLPPRDCRGVCYVSGTRHNRSRSPLIKRRLPVTIR